MLQPLSERLPDAVHHRDGGLHPLLVPDLHDLEPASRAALLFRHEIPAPLPQNLPAPTWNRVQPRALQLPNDLARLHPIELREKVDLARAEPVNMDRVVRL